MYEQAQKEKFVTTMVNNVDYYNKELTIKHLLDFLKANPNFSPREAIRKTSNDAFVSFIETTGFIQIDKSHIQMYIGIPVGYPRFPPIFLLAIDRNNYEVLDEQRLLQHSFIANQKNERNEEFIRLRFPVVEKQWNPKIQTIETAFINLMQIISRPPLIRPKFQAEVTQNQFRPANPQNTPNKIKRLNSKQVAEIVGKIYTDIVQVIIGKQNLEESRQVLDYNESRELFLRQHLSALKGKLEATRKSIDSECENIRNDIKQIELSGQCDTLLECAENERNKLNVLSQQQALKEAEVKLRSKMEKEQGSKFADYKKMMKVLYERMFDSQTRLLKLIK